MSHCLLGQDDHLQLEPVSAHTRPSSHWARLPDMLQIAFSPLEQDAGGLPGVCLQEIPPVTFTKPTASMMSKTEFKLQSKPGRCLCKVGAATQGQRWVCVLGCSKMGSQLILDLHIRYYAGSLLLCPGVVPRYQGRCIPNPGRAGQTGIFCKLKIHKVHTKKV